MRTVIVRALLSFGIDELFAVGFERQKRSHLILAHEARIAHNVGGKYRGEAAFHVKPP